jgi:periplasmic protein TonB
MTSASPEIQKLDLAPGPTMEESEVPKSVPQQQKIIEQSIAPTPPQQNPLVVVQEQKPNLEPATEKARPARERPKNPTEAPAPRTSAPPHTDRIAPAKQAQAGTSAAAAALSNYRQSLAVHLQRFKQYPSSARAAGEQGTPVVVFSVTRDGQATGLRLVQSSGHASLDAEAAAEVRRAQPLPAPPPEIPASSLTFSVPFNFTMK